MPSLGGSTRSISFDGRQFGVPFDADISIKLGGFENELQPNGDGSVRQVKTRVTGMLSGVLVSIDDSQQDQEYLQALADSQALAQVVIEQGSGVIYTGQGQIVSELIKTTQPNTATFDFAIQGALRQQ